MIRRINIYGGAGAGKSVLASWLFSEITIAGHRVQYVDEYCKLLACNGKVLKPWSQLYLLAKQQHKEHSYLESNNVDMVVSDCPLLMICTYAIRNKCSYVDEMLGICKKYDADYPAIHLFLDRADIPYRTEGRYETYEQAIQMDNLIEETIKKHVDSYHKVKTKDRTSILSTILKLIA